MFRKLLVGLAVSVVVLGTQVETAKAEVKVLTSVTGAGVLPGFTVKPGFITPVAGYYPAPAYSYYPAFPAVYPAYPTVYPTYPAYYPTPVYTPVVVVAPVHIYTVLYKPSVYHPFTVYGSYASHSLAHMVADGLILSGYHARVSH